MRKTVTDAERLKESDRETYEDKERERERETGIQTDRQR